MPRERKEIQVSLPDGIHCFVSEETQVTFNYDS